MSDEVFNDDDQDILCRFSDEKGRTITVLTAETLTEDGPVVIQTTEEDVVVVFSDSFVRNKVETMYERNKDELGESAGMIGLSYIIRLAVEAAVDKFASN